MSNLIKKIFGRQQSADAHSEDATIKVLDRAISELAGDFQVREEGSKSAAIPGIEVAATSTVRR